MSTYVIQTFGCRLNQAESATMAGGLEALGYVPFDEPSGATPDICILHTCAITHAAETEALRATRHARNTYGPDTLLVVAGCAPAIPGVEESFRAAGADLVIAQSDKPQLPAMVAATAAAKAACRSRDELTHCPIAPLSNCAEKPSCDRNIEKSENLTIGFVEKRGSILPRFSTTRAPIKVQDGCGFRCTYCIVPSTRGAPRSRPFEEIVREADGLFADGYRELVLTGVNIACYRHQGRGLRALVEALLALPSRRGGRIRIGSIEPATTERELLDLAAERAGLCRFFHFPLQSGCDRILRAMGRHYTVAQYEATVEAALERMPDACIGADVITGFPGEDEAAFEETVRFVEHLPFGNLHVFPYSERPGTPAAEMPGAVPMGLRRIRARRLLELADKKRAVFAQRFAGREVEVLIERVGKDGIGTGWTGEYLECHIPGCNPSDANTLRSVTVRDVDGSLLLAQ